MLRSATVTLTCRQALPGKLSPPPSLTVQDDWWTWCQQWSPPIPLSDIYKSQINFINSLQTSTNPRHNTKNSVSLMCLDKNPLWFCWRIFFIAAPFCNIKVTGSAMKILFLRQHWNDGNGSTRIIVFHYLSITKATRDAEANNLVLRKIS